MTLESGFFWFKTNAFLPLTHLSQVTLAHWYLAFSEPRHTFLSVFLLPSSFSLVSIIESPLLRFRVILLLVLLQI